MERIGKAILEIWREVSNQKEAPQKRSEKEVESKELHRAMTVRIRNYQLGN